MTLDHRVPDTGPPPSGDRGTATVDVHAHVLPGSAVEVLRGGGGSWFDVELSLGAAGNPQMTAPSGRRRSLGTAAYLRPVEDRVAWMDDAGLDVQVLSVPPPMFGYDLGARTAAALAREVNDELAAVVASRPSRFLAFATLPAQDHDAAVTELQRAMSLPGVVGVELGTNVDGRAWDDPALSRLLAAAEEAGALVFLHPNDVRGVAGLDGYHLRNLIGNPLETTAAAAALVFGGVLDRLPDLRVCLSHGGGFVSLAAGRFDHGWAVRPEARVALGTPPRDHLRRFLVDGLVHSPTALRYVVDVLGADRVVLGTDHPADMGTDRPVAEVLENELLDDEEKAAVLGGNLVRELGLVPSPAS